MVRELSETERLAIKHLLLTRLSCAVIGNEIGCSMSAAFKVLQKFELAGSMEKRRRCGRPKNTAEERRASCLQSY